MACEAIERGDSDMVWLLTGPGLLTRAFAQVMIEGGAEAAPESAPGRSRILELWEAQRVIGIHCPARYKRTAQHWSRAALGDDGPRTAPRALGLTIVRPGA